MNIKQVVKDAIEEFGESAFERFEESDGITTNNLPSNRFLIISLSDDLVIVRLKPLPDLFNHDVKFYGADAYLMWETPYTEKDGNPNKKTLDFLKNNIELELITRKNSAALPFELDRAIAGDVVEIMVDGEWKTCSIFECDNKTFSATAGDYWTGGSVINDADFLRMKFPKKAAI